MLKKNILSSKTVSRKTKKRSSLSKIRGLMLGGAMWSVCALFTPSPCESSPCSCWSAGTVGCHNWDTPGCARCWAGWDTGFFTKNFDFKEYEKVKKEIDDLFGGVMSKENWDKAKKAIDKATGVPVSMLWDPAFMLGSLVGAGVDAMENCRMACQTANRLNKLDQTVWWYADPTAMDSCKEHEKKYGIKIVNTYKFEMN